MRAGARSLRLAPVNRWRVLILVLALSLLGGVQAAARADSCCQDCPDLALCAAASCQGCTSQAMMAPSLPERTAARPQQVQTEPTLRIGLQRFDIWKPPRHQADSPST